jgi:hypothetical protein
MGTTVGFSAALTHLPAYKPLAAGVRRARLIGLVLFVTLAAATTPGTRRMERRRFRRRLLAAMAGFLAVGTFDGVSTPAPHLNLLDGCDDRSRRRLAKRIQGRGPACCAGWPNIEH